MKRRATGGESCEPERERERGRDKGRGGGMSTERDIYSFVPATQHMTTPRHTHAHAHMASPLYPYLVCAVCKYEPLNEELASSAHPSDASDYDLG